jgi:hypothetical protein
MLWRRPSSFASLPGRRSWCCTRGLQEIGEPLVLRRGCGRSWAHARLKASRLVNNSSNRRNCTHIRCCGCRVRGKRSDPRPLAVGVANRLRLGDRGTHVEGSFGSASVNTKDRCNSRKEHTWGRHGPRIKKTLWHSRVNRCRRSNALITYLIYGI